MKRFVLTALLVSTLITGYALIVFANSGSAQDFGNPNPTTSPVEVRIESSGHTHKLSNSSNPAPTAEPTPTSTLSPSPTPTATPLPAPTPTSNVTQAPTPTALPTPTPTASPTPSSANVTETPKPTATPIPTASPTPSPTSTPVPTTSTKISGYIVDSNGHGLEGALFTIMNTGQTRTNGSGYYSYSVAPGAYHLNVWPPWDSNFIDYDEPGFVVGSSDITKNITLNVGFKVSGYIFTSSGETVLRAVVVLGGNYLAGWGSNSSGYYFVCVPAGTYTLWAHPMFSSTSATPFIHYYEYDFAVYRDIAKNITVLTTTSTPTPTPSPSPNQLLFSVQSNSTVTGLSFNATTFALSFTVSGPSGTTGYTKVLVSKTISPVFTGISASIDGKQLNFAVSSSDEFWIVDFTYSHSTHYVVVNIPKNT